MHQHDKGTADHANDRDVPNEIEIELVIQGRVDCGSRVETKERVAVRLRAHDRFGRDIAGCACPVLDYEWLAKLLAEGLTQQAYEDVCAPTRWIANDRSNRPRWIGLRTCRARECWQHSSARGQSQKLSSVEKFHVDSPPIPTIRSPRRRGQAG